MSRERTANISQLRGATVDVLVVGGGINGAVAAAALAGTGVSVALVDRGDFACGVSSQSSNLAWGGIKYLESNEFRLVRKLCLSRNRLMDAYPATVREIRFFASIRRGFRMWSVLVWCGALLYWLMGNCRMQAPRYLRRSTIAAEASVVRQGDVVGGLEYSDCYLYDNDARFVFNFIRTAMDAGAIAANYVSMADMDFDPVTQDWRVTLEDQIDGGQFQLTAKSVINATGPGTDGVNDAIGVQTAYHHVLSKGIHLIVERVTDSNKVLTFFASDGRLFFVIPMGPRTCIGTTDTQVDRADVGVTDEDRDFVLANANTLLDLPHPLTRADIIAERVGVRPLAIAGAQGDRDWVQLSRKHEIEVDRARRYLSVFGGKLTDCLNIGEEIVGIVAEIGVKVPNIDARWFGEPCAARRAAFFAAAEVAQLDRLTAPQVLEPLSVRFWRRYGEGAFTLLATIDDDPTQAELVIAETEYTRAELQWVADREMVVNLEDFLRRRSKIALVVRQAVLADDPGLMRACQLFFGDQAADKLAAYNALH